MNIHFIGIEGVSMRVLARIMRARGHTVTGSDISTTGHRAEHIEGADAVVYTCAVGKSNPELLAAREKKLPCYERAEFLGLLAAQYRHVIAVSGSHGKTTTTGMLGKIFAPLEATLHIGGETDGESGHVGGSKYFITEACEYKRNFLYIKPEVSIVLNVELDHTDYYTDLQDITEAFDVFACSGRVKILNGDDENSRPLVKGNAITFGLRQGCDYQADYLVREAGGWGFCVFERGHLLGRVRLHVEGKHNVYNALAAVAAARIYGLRFDTIRAGLEAFRGAKRRFEHVGCYHGADVFSDYAHHPSELKSTIQSARDAGYGHVVVAFEPHTYTRTQSLLDQFAGQLHAADEVYLAPIYAAREEPIAGVNSCVLCRKLIAMGSKAVCCDTFYQLVETLRSRAEKGTAIVFAGAGTIDRAAHLLLDESYF